MAKITFKRDGKIIQYCNWIGEWQYEDVWAAYGKYDNSGNRTVKSFWHAYLINGEHIYQYTKEDLKKAIENRWVELYNIALSTNDEGKRDRINTVSFYAGKEVRKAEELTGNK